MTPQPLTSIEPAGFLGFLKRQGIERSIAWGYVALMLFMVGDGIESGFLSPYLDEKGFSGSKVALLWTVYGFIVAVAAWLSGALAEALGPRRVMLIGFAIWVVFEVAFLGIGVMGNNYTIMLIAFAIRAVGYPLFAYGFLVWVAMETAEARMGRAVGWYWFCSTMGLGVISSYLAAAVIPVFGELVTLWLSLAFVAIGGLLIIFMVRARPKTETYTVAEALGKMASALTIVKSHPKVGVGGALRLVNSLSLYAFIAFLTTYMVRDVGFSLSEWQAIWGTMLLSNVIANLLAGYAADWFGRVNVVAFGGCLGGFATIIGLYYVPATLGANFGAVMAIAIAYGFALACFVPLSAIVPMLVPKNIASGIAILNLGAGLSQFLGSAVAGLVSPLGVGGTMWVVGGVNLAGFFLTFALRDRKGKRPAEPTAPASERDADFAKA